MTFHLIAYPAGASEVVGTVHGSREAAESNATTHAHLMGEYIDVEQGGRVVATCDGQGAVPPYGVNEFRSI